MKTACERYPAIEQVRKPIAHVRHPSDPGQVSHPGKTPVSALEQWEHRFISFWQWRVKPFGEGNEPETGWFVVRKSRRFCRLCMR